MTNFITAPEAEVKWPGKIKTNPRLPFDAEGSRWVPLHEAPSGSFAKLAGYWRAGEGRRLIRDGAMQPIGVWTENYDARRSISHALASGGTTVQIVFGSTSMGQGQIAPAPVVRFDIRREHDEVVLVTGDVDALAAVVVDPGFEAIR